MKFRYVLLIYSADGRKDDNYTRGGEKVALSSL